MSSSFEIITRSISLNFQGEKVEEGLLLGESRIMSEGGPVKISVLQYGLVSPPVVRCGGGAISAAAVVYGTCVFGGIHLRRTSDTEKNPPEHVPRMITPF